MKKILVQSSIVLIFNLCVFAQSDNLPHIVTEFGKATAEELEAHLDHFATEIRKNPKSTARIIIYRDKDEPFGFPIRYGVRIQTYLLKNRGIESKRLEITNCGVSQSNLVQFLLIPFNYKSTSIDSLTCSNIEYLSNRKQSFLFDRFWYSLPNEGSDCCITDNYGDFEKTASLDAFAKKLTEDKTQKAVLIFYSYKCKMKEVCQYQPSDSPKLANRILKREKDYLIKKHNISLSRVITINGGYKRGRYSAEARSLEFWLVQKNGEIPKPKPDYYPKKKRSKK